MSTYPSARRRHAVMAASGSVLAALLLAALPAAADHDEAHTKRVDEQFYFHGDDLDQVVKLTGQVATFDQETPTAAEPRRQLASTLGEQQADLAAFWVGDFDGELDGEMTITVWAESVLTAIPNQIRVYADPTGANTLLTSGAFNLGGGAFPGAYSATLPVTGSVTGGPRIEITTAYEVPLLYDAASRASGFVLPTVVPCEEDDPHPDCEVDEDA